MPLRIGVMEKVLNQPRERVFRVAAELGFSGLELEVHGDLDLPRSEKKAGGVRVCSVICGGAGMGAAAVEARVEARERLQAAVGDATALGAPGILFPLFDLTGLDNTAFAERLVEDLQACLPDAEARGVVVAWENALNAADTREVIRQVGSDYFRCYFDLANASKRGADPAAELQALGDLVYQVHAKNTHKQPLDAPGVDLLACLRVLKKQGYPGWIVLETASGEDPLESARHNLEVVRMVWEAA